MRRLALHDRNASQRVLRAGGYANNDRATAETWVYTPEPRSARPAGQGQNPSKPASRAQFDLGWNLFRTLNDAVILLLFVVPSVI